MMLNPLLDYQFLYDLDHHRNRVTYVRITSLTIKQHPVEQIEGVATGGSITIDGTSSVRRICNLTMSTKNLNINRIYWGVSTKVRIELGLENNLVKYPYYDSIIWFPMGTYVLTDFKTSAQVNNYTITLTGKDKMCLLNGDIGGEFNAETDLGQEEVWDNELEKFVKYKRPIDYIIREMVHHYAQEDFNNIIIKDIRTGIEILTNRTDNNIFVIRNSKTGEAVDIIPEIYNKDYGYKYLNRPIDFTTFAETKGFQFFIAVDEDNGPLIETIINYSVIEKDDKYFWVQVIAPGEDLGYRLQQLEFPEDLIAAPGETVTSILDKIIKLMKLLKSNGFDISEILANLSGFEEEEYEKKDDTWEIKKTITAQKEGADNKAKTQLGGSVTVALLRFQKMQEIKKENLAVATKQASHLHKSIISSCNIIGQDMITTDVSGFVKYWKL